MWKNYRKCFYKLAKYPFFVKFALQYPRPPLVGILIRNVSVDCTGKWLYILHITCSFAEDGPLTGECPGSRWYSWNHRFRSNLAQCWVWWVNDRDKKGWSKYFIPFKLGGLHAKMVIWHYFMHYLICHLWMRISTTRKAMWKWNPLTHVAQLSNQLGNFILSKVHNSQCCDEPSL